MFIFILWLTQNHELALMAAILVFVIISPNLRYEFRFECCTMVSK